MKANDKFFNDLDLWRGLWPDNPSDAEVLRRVMAGEFPPLPSDSLKNLVRELERRRK